MSQKNSEGKAATALTDCCAVANPFNDRMNCQCGNSWEVYEVKPPCKMPTTCSIVYNKNASECQNCGIVWTKEMALPPCPNGNVIRQELAFAQPEQKEGAQPECSIQIIGSHAECRTCFMVWPSFMMFPPCPNGNIHRRQIKRSPAADAQPEPQQEKKQRRTAADILIEMGETYRVRNAVYGDNYKMVSKLVEALFPKGVPSALVITPQWHLFELQLVKLSRFAVSGLTHVDSVHDMAVYGAMIEMILTQPEEGENE